MMISTLVLPLALSCAAAFPFDHKPLKPLKPSKEEAYTLIGSQSDLFINLGASAPYTSYPIDFGVPRDVPPQCELTQLQMWCRHGERYPSNGTGATIVSLHDKLMKFNGTYNGSLSFLNDDYDFFIHNGSAVFEEEVTLENSAELLNPYTGQQDSEEHGREFLLRYESLIKDNTSFPVFTSNSKRCHDTAQYFIDGLGSKYDVDLQIISEAPSAGANSLTGFEVCPVADFSATDRMAAATANYTGNATNSDSGYLQDIAKRLNNETTGLNLSTTDVSHLYNWCSYEISAKGYSEMCEIFSQEEILKLSYDSDVTTYYSMGPGNPSAALVGSNLLNASLELLQQSTELTNKVWLNFHHDIDVMTYLMAVGMFSGDEPLIPGRPILDRQFHYPWITPMGARVYLEQYTCDDEQYVRYVVNDVVIPFDNCSSGPGFSCPQSQYESLMQDRLDTIGNFVQQCNLTSVSNVTELTFYWDYETKNYTAPLLLQ